MPTLPERGVSRRELLRAAACVAATDHASAVPPDLLFFIFHGICANGPG